MKLSDYWRGRFEQLEESLLRYGADYYADLEREFRTAVQNIEKDIAVWYQRLAANNGISYAEAKKLLTANELAEFHWNVEEYIKRGKESAVDQRWMKQLENASAKVHISRLEAMKLQLQQQAEVLYGNHLDGLDKAMRTIYGEGYYRTAFEIQRGLNVGYTLHQLDERRIAAVLAKPWAADSKNFSDRIWTDKNKLIHTLHTELTQATIRGDPPDQTIRTLAQKMKASQSAAGRLVMTESAFFAAASQRDCFGDLDVKQYEIVATLDSHTSPTCRELDGKVFAIADYKPGITAPPFHCWCRSVTAPHFADEKGGRAARGEDGKTYYVPSSMKYPEWKKVYVDKEITPEEWQNSHGNGIIKSYRKNDGAIQVHKVGALDKDIYKVVSNNIITDIVVITDRQIEHIKERHPDNYERFAKYFAAIISDPEYILEANRPDTAFVLKSIKVENEKFQLILRLVTSNDPKGYQNSIITFLKVSDKKWRKYLRNKKILYAKE